jgi:hypothetical protein
VGSFTRVRLSLPFKSQGVEAGMPAARVVVLPQNVVGRPVRSVLQRDVEE